MVLPKEIILMFGKPKPKLRGQLPHYSQWLVRSLKKTKIQYWAEGCSSVVEPLPNMCETLALMPSTKKGLWEKTCLMACVLRTVTTFQFITCTEWPLSKQWLLFIPTLQRNKMKLRVIVKKILLTTVSKYIQNLMTSYDCYHSGLNHYLVSFCNLYFSCIVQRYNIFSYCWVIIFHL